MPPMIVSEIEFQLTFKEELGVLYYERALAIFREFGEDFSFDVVDAMLYAIEQGKVDKVISILEEELFEQRQVSVAPNWQLN